MAQVVTTTPTTTTAGPYSHAGDNVTVIGDGQDNKQLVISVKIINEYDLHNDCT